MNVVDHADASSVHRLAGGAIHQHLLGAEHLRHLGQQHGAARRGEAVGDAADQRVGRDAAEAVRAAALVPQHQRGRRAPARAGRRAMRSTSSSMRAMPDSTSSDTSCALKYRMPAAVDVARLGEQRFIWLFSQPSPSTSTPPAFGWRIRPASICRVCPRSSPSCQQPYGCANACTPSIDAGEALACAPPRRSAPPRSSRSRPC